MNDMKKVNAKGNQRGDERRDLDSEARRSSDQQAGASLEHVREQVEQLTGQLGGAQDRIDELEAQLDAAPTEAPAPAGDADLRALASTVRTAQRNGHPDAAIHMDALLRALGA